MPKDEFDLEDPMELVACEVPLGEEHMLTMAECFIEEFRRMRWTAPAVYSLFRDPHFYGPHSVLERLGDARVRSLIEQQFGPRVLAAVLPVIKKAPSSNRRLP